MLADGSSGSGFLIKGNILITNNHVLPSTEVARTPRVEFNYQKSPEGLDEPVDTYRLNPDVASSRPLPERNRAGTTGPPCR